MKDLKLYFKHSCPYCQKVLHYMDENDVKGVQLMDIKADPKNQEDLVKLGGKDMVPMLLIDGKPMYESDDIVLYMKDTL
jgi:glutaredoxin